MSAAARGVMLAGGDLPNVPRPLSRLSGAKPPPAPLPSSMRMDKLDDTLLRLILRHTRVRDMLAVSSVCRSWNRVCADEQLWHRRAYQDLNATARPPWCDSWRAAYRDGVSEGALVGDALEVRDMYGLWVTARVVARLDPLRLLCYFEGWSEKWLVWVHRALDRGRLRELGSDEGDCPGLGSGGPLSAEAFQRLCGAVHCRLAKGRSQWPPPSREHHGAHLPAMYGDGGGGRVGSAGAAPRVVGGGGRGGGGGHPSARHAAQVDGSITVTVTDPARLLRLQTLLTRRKGFRTCREVAAERFAQRFARRGGGALGGTATLALGEQKQAAVLGGGGDGDGDGPEPEPEPESARAKEESGQDPQQEQEQRRWEGKEVGEAGEDSFRGEAAAAAAAESSAAAGVAAAAAGDKQGRGRAAAVGSTPSAPPGSGSAAGVRMAAAPALEQLLEPLLHGGASAGGLHCGSGGRGAAGCPYRVGEVVLLELSGVAEQALLPQMIGDRGGRGDVLTRARLTVRVMVVLNEVLFLGQCEGWRQHGLLWLHAELDAHLLTPLGGQGQGTGQSQGQGQGQGQGKAGGGQGGQAAARQAAAPEQLGPAGLGPDGPMSAEVFERLQFGEPGCPPGCLPACDQPCCCCCLPRDGATRPAARAPAPLMRG
jgi:hypothetical protein